MKKIFIYYSLTSNGDTIANILKENNIEIRKVNTIKKMPKSFVGQILKGGFLASINYKSKLVNFNNDIKDYDEIIIGSPIWNGRLSCPINTVLSKLSLNNKKLIFLLYSGSGTSPKAIEKIKKLYPEAEIINIKEPNKNIDLLKEKVSYL